MKQGVAINLKFLFGLFVTLVLIWAALSMVNFFSNAVENNYEADLINNWVDEIDIVSKQGLDVATELLPLTDLDGNNLIFVFQETSKDLLGVSPDNVELRKPTGCLKDSCICAFNTKRNRFEDCMRVDAPTFNIVGDFYDPEAFYVFTNDKSKIKADQPNRQIYVEDRIFIQRNSGTIEFCTAIQDGRCIEEDN